MSAIYTLDYPAVSAATITPAQPSGIAELSPKKFNWLSKTGIEWKAALKSMRSIAKADEQTQGKGKRL